MKFGDYAVYQGKEYTSGKVRSGKLILRSTDLRDVEKGFEVCEPFHIKDSEEEIVCLKYVERFELEEYYSLTTFAYYKGYKFEVMEEKDDMISIWSLMNEGSWDDWIELGMTCVNKGEYQKWIKKSEAEIVIERKDR